MQMAFGKLPPAEFWFLFSRRKSVFGCWRSFYLILNEKVFPFPCKCCIEARFSRCSSQEFIAFTELICLAATLWTCRHYLSCLLHEKRKGKTVNFSHYVTLFKQRSHSSSGAFLYVGNSLHSCIFLRSCGRKFVFRFWIRARCPRNIVTVVNNI